MNPLILGIETSTLSCSVALFSASGIHFAEQFSEERHVHASRLLPLIDRALSETGHTVSDLAAVAVCAGPGSYTGLRIGVSTAKGLCHAKNLPLIAVNSLEIQAYGVFKRTGNSGFVPTTVVAVMDARRDEVYTQTFRLEGDRVVPLDATRALVLEEHIPLNQLFPQAAADTVVIGDAALKTQSLLGDRGASWTYLEAFPEAQWLATPSLHAFSQRMFEDVAYFEPRYLKEFQAGMPKDPLGLRKSVAS